jgi:hypothetical protein
VSGIQGSGVTREATRYQVSFKEVGRGKKSWVEILKQKPTEAILQRVVRKSGALMSRDIICEFSDPDHGTVYAGMRPVGTFEVIRAVVSDPGPFNVDHINAAFAGLV